MGLFSSKYN